MILAADVGGTKVHCALVSCGDPEHRVREGLLRTADVRDPVETLAGFAALSPAPLRGAVLGVAGPVLDNAVRGANLPWAIEGAKLSRRLGGLPVRVVNDLEAAAWALERLDEDDLATLQAGTERDGHRVLVSPGTGLGEAIVLRREGKWIPVAGEGGHADFAARTEEESDLVDYLRAAFGRVSWERVVSGPGLVNIHCWLRDRGRVQDDAGIPAAPGASDPAALIGEAALRGASRLCAESVRVWWGALAAEAANQVLRVVARGGVFLGGGIPAKLLPLLQVSTFVDVFRSKAPHEELLRSVPVHVVRAGDVALRGAVRLAVDLAAST